MTEVAFKLAGTNFDRVSQLCIVETAISVGVEFENKQALLKSFSFCKRKGEALVSDDFCCPHRRQLQTVFELIEDVLEYADVQAVTLERDERLEAVDEIESELQRLNEVIERHCPESAA